MGGAFDCLNWQHSREFDQNFLKKSNAWGFAWGAWAVLELTSTLHVITVTGIQGVIMQVIILKSDKCKAQG